MIAYLVTPHILVGIISIGSGLQGVCPRFGDGIDTSSDEVGLAYVEGSDNNLDFLDGIK